MDMKQKLLIVDDEWNMRNLLRIHLGKEYEVTEASDGYEALRLIDKNEYDLVVLDVMMPNVTGWDVCQKIREKKQTPILMVTARNELKDRVHGLDLGADDYLTKPFAPEELKARVNALIRRSSIKQSEQQQSFSFLTFLDGFLTIDTESRQIVIDKNNIDFTPKEFNLIHLLASQPKRVFTREVLLDAIWGINDPRDTRTVDTHIKNIRVKLRNSGCSFNPIQTVWGVGYKFKHPDEKS